MSSPVINRTNDTEFHRGTEQATPSKNNGLGQSAVEEFTHVFTELEIEHRRAQADPRIPFQGSEAIIPVNLSLTDSSKLRPVQGLTFHGHELCEANSKNRGLRLMPC
jgi:hypothetical protein